MAFKKVSSLDADTTTALGGINKKTGKPNPTKIEGYFLGSREVESKMSNTGFAKIHVFQTANGNVGVWGKTDLDRKLNQVTPGVMTRVVQDGKVNIPGRNPMYKFSVEIDEENSIEVASEESSLETGGIDGDGQPHYDGADEAEGLTGDDSFEDTDLDADEQLQDEVPPARPAKPARAATTPDAARQAKVKELLAKGNRKTA